MDPWVESAAAAIAGRAERELEALVGVSSPSGDVPGAEEAAAICATLLPDEARVERPACSSPDHARDLIATVTGEGTRRILLLGHVDTVFDHASHRALERKGDRLIGSGAVDMKGGVVLALGVLRAIAARRDAFAKAAILLVCDEEWRTRPFVHADRFTAWDACLCFEAGERTADGHEGVVVRRKAAGTLRVVARGLAAHSGSAPDRGRNALLALAAVAERVAACHDPDGPDRLSAVPTVMHAGDAFNVVPAEGELLCDLRADRDSAFDDVLAAVPEEVGGAELEPHMLRLWPGMDTREVAAPLLTAATDRLGRPVVPVERGGASDASHFGATIPLAVDGLGPRGGGAHTPEEYLRTASLRERAEVGLALVAALLEDGPP